MDNNEFTNEKKGVNKTKSCNDSYLPPIRVKTESVKRKSYYVNDAVKSLDLALGKLKKSKLVNVECPSSSNRSPMRPSTEMFVDSPSCFCNQSADNVSLMSMNFSHYELIRNVSRINCNSDGACSGNTANTCPSPTDMMVKDENIEKYFRSAEMWNRNFRGNESNPHSELPKK